MAGEAWITGVTVSAAVLWVGSFAGAAVFGEGPVEFDSTVTSVEDGGRTICVDRPQDACGLRIDHPEHATPLKTGDRVRVTELWLGSGTEATLTFHVRSR